MDPSTDVGTVINERSAILFENRVNDAVERGAEILHGAPRRGALFAPTVVDHVPADCELVFESRASRRPPRSSGFRNRRSARS